MNAEVKAIPQQNQSLKPNQIVIIGRIDRITKCGGSSKRSGTYDHVVTTAAPDEFSQPSVALVNASRKLEDVGNMVKVLCLWNGWPNSFDARNEDGEKVKVYDVRGYFVAVE